MSDRIQYVLDVAVAFARAAVVIGPLSVAFHQCSAASSGQEKVLATQQSIGPIIVQVAAGYEEKINGLEREIDSKVAEIRSCMDACPIHDPENERPR